MREANMWILHSIAGLIIFFLLSLHMAIMHLDDILTFLGIGYHDPIGFESVLDRSRQFFFLITYIMLLGVALYHGLYGFRTILFELTLSTGTERLVTGLFIMAGIGLFIFGTYAAIIAYLMPN